jgi:NAD-dependent dihydropyrimidine dehydrogenase PreA subunit
LPELMRMERYTEVFGLTEWLSEERVGKLFVDTSQCGNCGICEERCPINLPIIKRLGNCQNYLTRPA